MGDLVAKLNPDKIRCSGKFTAMLAFILGERWTDPAITGLWITSDDVLLVGDEGDPLANQIVGSGSDLWRNLRGIASAAGLTKKETSLLLRTAERKVSR